MHLVIDLRFYRPEPYGLAVHIGELFAELVPLLQESKKYTKITLILDYGNKNKHLEKHLSWFESVTNGDKIEIFWSKHRYYSLGEQLGFCIDLYKLRADMVFFFTFNFPILYFKPFIYQVLDLTIAKTSNQKSPKTMAMMLCIRQGLLRAKEILFLGYQTQLEAQNYTKLQFTDPNLPSYKQNTVVWNGVGRDFLNSPKMPQNEQTSGKPYFFFVSVWRKYKNLDFLVTAFELFQKNNNFSHQLVIAGVPDAKDPKIIDCAKNSPESKNIQIFENVSQEKLVNLYDYCEALVFPSLSEGFGLALVEAVARGKNVICSDIKIFREIMQDGAIYFDPLIAEDITRAMLEYSKLSLEEKNQLQIRAKNATKTFSWKNTAQLIASRL